MSLDPSHAVVERTLRDVVNAQLPEVPSRPPGAPIDRSFRGWLRRWVLPRLLSFLIVVAIIWGLFQVVDLLFAPRLVWCSDTTPQGVRMALCGIDFWPYGDIDMGIAHAN